jgi:hypothetical protein
MTQATRIGKLARVEPGNMVSWAKADDPRWRFQKFDQDLPARKGLQTGRCSLHVINGF